MSYIRPISCCVNLPVCVCFLACVLGFKCACFWWGCLFAEPGLTCWPPRCLLLSPRHAATRLSAWLFMQRSKLRTSWRGNRCKERKSKPVAFPQFFSGVIWLKWWCVDASQGEEVFLFFLCLSLSLSRCKWRFNLYAIVCVIGMSDEKTITNNLEQLGLVR